MAARHAAILPPPPIVVKNECPVPALMPGFKIAALTDKAKSVSSLPESDCKFFGDSAGRGIHLARGRSVRLNKSEGRTEMKIERLVAAAAAGGILLGAMAALAQDPVKLAPDQNKVLLDNDRVRVYEVKNPPGGTLEMHSHPAHVVYFLGAGKAKFTDKDGKVTETESKAGEARFVEPVTHKVENVGSTPLRVVVIELKDEGK